MLQQRQLGIDETCAFLIGFAGEANITGQQAVDIQGEGTKGQAPRQAGGAGNRRLGVNGMA